MNLTSRMQLIQGDRIVEQLAKLCLNPRRPGVDSVLNRVLPRVFKMAEYFVTFEDLGLGERDA